MLKRKDCNVKPRPLIVLIRFPFVYRKGHIHANVIINSPAISLWNRNSPINEPNTIKPIQQRRPKEKQQKTEVTGVKVKMFM